MVIVYKNNMHVFLIRMFAASERNTMKRPLLLLTSLCLLLIALAGCRKASYPPLKQDDGDLNQSMKDYFATVDMGYGEGKLFSAKMLECKKVIFNREDYDTSYSNYLYRVVIAPKTEAPMNKISVMMYPTFGIDKYYKEYAIGGRHTLEMQELGFGSYPELHIEKKGGLVAIDFFFYLNNMGDDQQHKANIGEKEFDAGMTTLRIEIDCDGNKDTIQLSFTGKLMKINRMDDPLALSDKHVMNLLTNGGTNTYMGPYLKSDVSP